MQDFFLWKETDTILSLGAGAAWWEIKLLYQNPAKKIVLIDENIDILNRSDLNESIRFFKKYYPQTFRTKVEIVHTLAEEYFPKPKTRFDWVWCFNSWHEFKNPEQILKNLQKALPIGSYFFLEENLSIEKRAFHEDCGLPLYFPEELFAQFIKFGFELVEMEDDWQAPYLLFRKNF